MHEVSYGLLQTFEQILWVCYRRYAHDGVLLGAKTGSDPVAFMTDSRNV